MGSHARREERTNALWGAPLFLHLSWHSSLAKQRTF
jgi:hypothetical protein